MHPHTARALVAALALVPFASAQSSPLITTGDSLPGLGAVTNVHTVAIADGGHWIAQVAVAGGYAIVRDGVVLLKSGDPLAPSGVFNGAPSVNLNANLESAFAMNFGLYFGTAPLLTEASSVAGYSATAKYSHLGDLELNDARQVLASATIYDLAVTPLSIDTMVLLQADATGALVSQTYLVQENDVIPGLAGAVRDVSNFARGFALSNSGDALYHVLTYGSESAVLLNGTVVAKSGGPSPTFGAKYYSILDSVALSEQGNYALLANYGTGLGLVYDGAEVAHVGASMPSVPSFELTGFGPRTLEMDAAGRIFWFADWNDPDESRDEGIVRDQELLVQEGVSLAGGQVITALDGGFDVSKDGRYLAYIGTRADGVQGAFLLDLQGGITPFFGCAPNPATLQVTGTAEPGGGLSALLQQPQNDTATGYLMFSSSNATGPGGCGIAVPGIGEVLIGAPFAVLPPTLEIPPIGTYVTVPIPNQLALAGAVVYTQGAFVDFAGLTPSEPVRLTDAATITIGL